MANIEWNEDAVKDLAKLDKQVAQRILKKIIGYLTILKKLLLNLYLGNLKEHLNYE